MMIRKLLVSTKSKPAILSLLLATASFSGVAHHSGHGDHNEFSPSEMSTSTNSNKTIEAKLHDIKNFQFVSKQLASSGNLSLEQYQHIDAYGFKHVINLIPGMQLREKRHVESLGLSYKQISVDWGNPTLADFEQFVSLMKSYGNNKVFVHCQLNWRAASFVYLYQVTQLGIDKVQAAKDLHNIWTPHDGWDQYINKVIAHYDNI